MATVLVAGSGLMQMVSAVPGNIAWDEAGSSGIVGEPDRWSSIASSADGTKLIATTSSYIYTSTDSGVTWTERTSAGSHTWGSVVSSSDGTKLAAIGLDWNGSANVGYVYISSDSGTTWTQRTSGGSRTWSRLVASADGDRLMATVGQSIYTSADTGVTWTERASAGLRSWVAIASSADGSKLTGAVGGGYIYTSIDSGATWTERVSSGSRSWRSLASSADGEKLVAGVYTGYIYTSTDAGITWVQRTSAGSHVWESIATSSDGVKLAAVERSWNGSTWKGYVYASIDSGVTWVQRPAAGQRNWWSVATSADGSKLVAMYTEWGGSGAGYLYTSTDSGETWTVRPKNALRYWRAITSNRDGTKLAAVGTGSCTSVFLSSDSGATWIERSFDTANWFCAAVAMSDDGSKIIVGTEGGSLYISNNAGLTWSTATGLHSNQNDGSYFGLAMTPDGNTVAVTDNNGVDGNGGGLYISHDGGVSWQEQTSLGKRYWSDSSHAQILDISTDGQTIAVADSYGSDWNGWGGGYVYITRDGGQTWSTQSSLGAQGWGSLAMSDDGTKILLASSWGYLYTSADSGATWTERTSAGSRSWSSVASSADGTKLAAAISWNGSIYTSMDSGATWTEQTGSGLRSWESVTSSADGTKLAAAVYGGNIYLGTLEGPVTTTLNFNTVASSPADPAPASIAQSVLSVTSSTCYTIDPASAKALGPDSLVAPEAGVSILGGLAFNLTCVNAGGTSDVGIALNAHYTDTTQLRAYKASTGSKTLVDITDQVTFTNQDVNGTKKTVVSYALLDGGTLDEDGTANGTIVDPIYVGAVAGAVAADGSLADTGVSSWAFAGTGLIIATTGIVLTLKSRRHRQAQMVRQ